MLMGTPNADVFYAAKSENLVQQVPRGDGRVT